MGDLPPEIDQMRKQYSNMLKVLKANLSAWNSIPILTLQTEGEKRLTKTKLTH